MAKLYPPYVEGTIPACTGTVLTVPFSMNKAVGKNEVKGFILKLKTVQNSLFIDNIPHLEYSLDPEGKALFDLSDVSLKVGQYYKAQLAFVDETGMTGHFSTVGVFKYTADPVIGIEGFDMTETNKPMGSYIGTYSQKNLDPSEKIYSYQFKLYNSEGKVIEDSGELLHNSTKDTTVYDSYDEYMFHTELEENVSYFVNYTITTMNGLHKSTPRYRMIKARSIPPEIQASLKAELNFDNGYIELNLIGDRDPETDIEYITAGAFVIMRRADLPEARWEEILRFALQAETPSRLLLRDCTIQQGVSYVYSLQQYNDNGLYSERILSNKVYADFEDAFLYDGDRQLKIRYNPKVSSFKNTILESKIDTLGSKHPFIFRNGNVKYKEFPISGLISYLMDEENLFIPKEEFDVKEKTTNLISENIAAEREFKLQVLEWLGNGEPKLFRSPGEGNYIVRLMNTSFTPTDTVGRMLHSFNCTAYEIDDCTYENLGKYDILKIAELDTTRIRWASVELRGAAANEALNTYPAETVSFVDMIPGDIVYLDNESYMIGATGGYSITSTSKPFKSVRVAAENSGQGSLTYAFYSEASTVYELINDVHATDYPARQWIGETGNIIKEIENARDTIIRIFSLQFRKRPIYYAFYKDNNDKILYEDNICTKVLTAETADPFALYDVRNATDTYNGLVPDPEKAEYYIDRQFDLYYPRPSSPYYYDGQNFGAKKILLNKYKCSFTINGNEMNLEETEYFNAQDFMNIEEITLGNGVWLEIGYQLRQVDYHLQFDNKYPCKPIYDAYIGLLNQYNNKIDSIKYWSDSQVELNETNDLRKQTFYEEVITLRKATIKAYKDFIAQLEIDIKKYKEDNAITW